MPTAMASPPIDASLSNPFAPCQSRPGTVKLALNNGRRPRSHAGRAGSDRVARVPVPRAARAGSDVAPDARVGNLRHRQAHVPRRDRAVRRHGSRPDDAVPHHPGTRERRRCRGNRAGRGASLGRPRAGSGRPGRAGSEPALRRVPLLPRRLPLLPLRADRELRQLADRCRAAAPVRGLERAALPPARYSGLPCAGRAADRRRRAHGADECDALARSRFAAAASRRFPER